MEDPTAELITTLGQQMKDASDKIADLETEYILEDKRVGEQRAHVENLKTGIAQAVANAREDVTGKPKFSNDLARKAEVEDRLVFYWSLGAWGRAKRCPSNTPEPGLRFAQAQAPGRLDDMALQ